MRNPVSLQPHQDLIYIFILFTVLVTFHGCDKVLWSKKLTEERVYLKLWAPVEEFIKARGMIAGGRAGTEN